MFKEIDLGNNKNLFTVSAILIAGIGGLAIRIPYQLNDAGKVVNTITITSIATALILGICTYAVINFIEKKEAAKGITSEDAEASMLTEPSSAKSTYEVGVKDEAATEDVPATEEKKA